MCLSSVSGYRPLIYPPPSLENSLLDITVAYVEFHSGDVFLVNFRIRVRLGLGLGFVFGIGNLKHI